MVYPQLSKLRKFIHQDSTIASLRSSPLLTLLPSTRLIRYTDFSKYDVTHPASRPGSIFSKSTPIHSAVCSIHPIVYSVHPAICLHYQTIKRERIGLHETIDTAQLTRFSHDVHNDRFPGKFPSTESQSLPVEAI
jgi:hypothetical protein